jgi:hypothetical protein
MPAEPPPATASEAALTQKEGAAAAAESPAALTPTTSAPLIEGGVDGDPELVPTPPSPQLPLPSLEQRWSPYLSRVSSVEPPDAALAKAYKAIFNYK